MSQVSLAQQAAQLLDEAVRLLAERAPQGTVVLIGSAARGCMTERSDLDIMVITAERLERLPAHSRIHIHPESRAGFFRRLTAGDEFISWAVRYGTILSDPSCWWAEVTAMSLPWPDWRQKLDQISKRLRTAEAAIRDSDRSAAEEELMMAASHCARALLLKAGEFPLSRPELSRQLDEIAESELSQTLVLLMKGVQTIPELKSTFASLKRLFRNLRKEAFLIHAGKASAA